MKIGKIVRSNSHIDYVAHVYCPGEVADPPALEDYAFGTFVQMTPHGSSLRAVGAIYNSTLLNPEYGSLGPRLSSTEDLGVFSPDYLTEKAVLVGIALLGYFDVDHDTGELRPFQGMVPVSLPADTDVEPLPDDEFVAFHCPSGRACLNYYPLLLSHDGTLASQLALHVLERLKRKLPYDARLLGVLANNLAWRVNVEGVNR